ncbi:MULTISPECIES: hypothetical protein [Nocardia]|uniref:hypothetical protein n=1 Tax=Nocardia TaxID=1817 RepID=UPI001893C61B|nr:MULTISPECIES: hypothetical protein [Nocardia]MBF6348387.1 hypothetical protein [Nocardia flavorosea]
MFSGTRLRTVTCTAVITLAAGLGSAACSSDRWCEFDATDTKVADSYCEKGTPGYEWEPDSDGKGKSKKTKSTTSKRHR